MRILLVYPKCPDTFWSFRHILSFISKKAAYPPLGLLTVAAMLPEEWKLKLVDMNVATLTDKDIQEADYVFISAMDIQKKSVDEVIAQCKKCKTKIVAGGPLFTTRYEEFTGVDHLVLDEAEITLPRFLGDLKNGSAKPVYTSDERPDIRETPIPLWKLIDPRKYAAMETQISRGCSFNCDFCDITLLFGQKIRRKTKEQIIAELESLHSRGWRGGIFIVDDNFIANKKELKEKILPVMINWMNTKKHPFSFIAQVGINLSDDEELIRMMVEAGFRNVFIGIETPHKESLAECGKLQNLRCDLKTSIEKIQEYGLQVMGGFIVGFDNDPPSIFERLIAFIQESGIVIAMVGMLNAPYGTKLYCRLVKENRLLGNISGSNTDLSTNFIPIMGLATLIKGYRKILATIYSPKQYYERVRTFLKKYRLPNRIAISQFKLCYLEALLKSIWYLGIRGKERVHYWKLVLWTLIRRPNLLPLVLTLAIYGYHFRLTFENLHK